MTAPLKTHGLTIIETSAPKQTETETTQRWQVGLSRVGDELPIRTKVEFSRRDDIEGTKYEAADREVLRPYGLTPVLASPSMIAIERLVELGLHWHHGCHDASCFRST